MLYDGAFIYGTFCYGTLCDIISCHERIFGEGHFVSKCNVSGEDILLVNVTFLERTFCDGMFHNGIFSVFFTN